MGEQRLVVLPFLPFLPFQPFLPSRPRQRQRRVHAHPQHRPHRQLDVLPLGRGNRPAAADENAGERAFGAADDRTDNRAGARADPDLLGLALDAFALERLRDGRRASDTTAR